MALSYFADDSSQAKRGYQIWLILIGLAHRRANITYGQLADLIGFGGALALAGPLGCIMWYCIQHKLPPLTVLVVNKDTGTPSEGLGGVDDFDIARERVFNYSWFDLVPPTVEELRDAQLEGHAVGWEA